MAALYLLQHGASLVGRRLAGANWRPTLRAVLRTRALAAVHHEQVFHPRFVLLLHLLQLLQLLMVCRRCCSCPCPAVACLVSTTQHSLASSLLREVSFTLGCSACRCLLLRLAGPIPESRRRWRCHRGSAVRCSSHLQCLHAAPAQQAPPARLLPQLPVPPLYRAAHQAPAHCAISRRAAAQPGGS